MRSFTLKLPETLFTPGSSRLYVKRVLYPKNEHMYPTCIKMSITILRIIRVYFWNIFSREFYGSPYKVSDHQNQSLLRIDFPTVQADLKFTCSKKDTIQFQWITDLVTCDWSEVPNPCAVLWTLGIMLPKPSKTEEYRHTLRCANFNICEVGKYYAMRQSY